MSRTEETGVKGREKPASVFTKARHWGDAEGIHGKRKGGTAQREKKSGSQEEFSTWRSWVLRLKTMRPERSRGGTNLKKKTLQKEKRGITITSDWRDVSVCLPSGQVEGSPRSRQKDEGALHRRRAPPTARMFRHGVSHTFKGK